MRLSGLEDYEDHLSREEIQHLYDGVVWRELKEVAEGDTSPAVPLPEEE
jgi:hypothetical protein